jgi:hypothetical protein
MRTIYIADDGTQFDDEYDCQDYEWKLKHPGLKDIIFYDMKDDVLEDIFSQTTYEDTMKIVVSTDEAVKDLYELGRYYGWCAYEDVTEAGTWVWENGLNGKFVKV